MARGLTPEQERVGRDFARALAGAPYIVRKAAYEAGLVESNLRNLNYGDRDSLGALQERTSIYGRSHALSPLRSAQRFRSEAEALLRKGFKGDSGALAQAVQRSAFPGRYAQRGGEAAQLVKAFGGGGGSSSLTDAASGASPVAAGPAGVAQGSEGALALIQALSGQQRPVVASGGLAPPAASAAPPLPQGYQPLQSSGGPAPKPDIDALLAAVQTVGGDVPQAPDVPVAMGGGGGSSSAGSASTSEKGVASFGGKKVAAWIAPALEYARAHGWKGNVNSGYRSTAEQRRIYNSGVRPAAKPGTSNHEFTAYPGGAVDVSDAEQLARILERSPWRKKLVWAGSKDPVHFSHPRNGTY